MTSHELARQLLEGPDMPVIMSKDPEGNFFRPLADIGRGHYYAGDIYDQAEMEPADFTRMTYSVILWP